MSVLPHNIQCDLLHIYKPQGYGKNSEPQHGQLVATEKNSELNTSLQE